MEQLNTPGPTVILADDLHWLDSDSLVLLSELATRIELPVLLIAASRPADQATVPELCARTLDRLASHPRTVRLPLTGLPLSAVGRLLADANGQPAQPNAVRAIHQRTGGNAYWITELLAANTGTSADSAHIPLPEHLASLVLARLAGLPDSARALLRAISLLGQRVPVRRIQAVWDHADLDGDLAQLRRAGLLYQDGVDAVRFDHALAREAIAATVLPTEATHWHRNALDVASRDGDEAAVAEHARALGNLTQALQATRRAAHSRLRSGTPDSAYELAREGLDLAAEDPELLELAGRAAQQSGDLAAARQHTQHLAEVAVSVATRGTAQLRLSQLAWSEGHIAAQWQYLDQAEKLAHQHEHHKLTARCLVARSQALMRAEDQAAALQTCTKAETLVEEAGLGREQRWSLHIDRGTVLCQLGDSDTGEALLFRVWHEAQAAGDAVTVARAVNNLLTSRPFRISEDMAWSLYERAVTAIGPVGMMLTGGKITRAGVDLAASFGHAARAHELLEERLPIEPDPCEQIVLSVKSGLLAVESDDLETATRIRDRTLAAISGVDQFWVRIYPALLAVVISGRRGVLGELWENLNNYLYVVDQENHARRSDQAATAAVWTLHGGLEPAEVEQFLVRCLPATFPTPAATSPESMAATEAWVATILRERRGQHTAALATGPRALSDRRISAHLRAETHMALAHCAEQQHDLPTAHEHASSSVALLRRWPGWRQDQATALAHRLATPPVELTPRERDVLHLVTEGSSNRQVSRALGISERTVEVHVSRILAKTGHRSRAELIRWSLT